MYGAIEDRMFISHPTEIGPYRVLEVLGQGGVGTVYLVQQHEPIRRKAALKLVKLGMDTREVLVRFSQERQMLALMNHPNIAKVFDAGQTETGRPYFVMEYVAGEPITDYCDRNRLDLRERLELFVTVCRAIQHAHQRGNLHRDRRYQSAAELAADVERYLKREPIAARPPSASYRFERFVRRNPLAVVGMLAVVLALVLGSALSYYSFKRANDLREPKAALMQMCENIRTDVADAHLWFEEVIAGDQSQDLQRDVLVPLNRSAKRVAEALDVSAPSPEQAAARDPERTEQLGRLRDEIATFLAATMQRWDTKADAGRIGGALDQQYDATYKRILGVCSQIVSELNESSSLDFRRTAQTALMVNGAILFVLVGASALAFRYWLRRT